MRTNETRLTADEERMIARFAATDLDADELNPADVQRYFEHGSTQSRLYKRASFGSDASIRRIIREARAIQTERADIARALGR